MSISRWSSRRIWTPWAFVGRFCVLPLFILVILTDPLVRAEQQVPALPGPSSNSATSGQLQQLQQQQQQQQQRITDVSVVCAANAITGQFVFSGPFGGKIYASRYANVHDCIYYNNYGENMIMFTVPNYKCGTVVQKNTQNIISHIENEVYVQFDKETQNVEDRRFLFICDRAESSPSAGLSSPFPSGGSGGGNGIGIGGGGGGGGGAVTYRGTIQPGQTIIVQTIEPTRLSATDSSVSQNPNSPQQQQPYVWMEIEDGLGPRKSPVQRPLHLGDQVTLVVTGRSSNTGSNQYDMFVHSCFASDGSGQNKIQLTDPAGCTSKSSVAGKMARERNATEITYYLPLKAFKFPNSDDVYFSCAVEVCSTCNFPDLCPNEYSATNRTRRKSPPTGGGVKLSNNEAESIQVHDYVKIMDSTDVQALRRDTPNGRSDSFASPSSSTTSSNCFDRSVVAVLLTITAALLTALICVSMYAMYLLRQRKQA